jgi:hypothetical protein
VYEVEILYRGFEPHESGPSMRFRKRNIVDYDGAVEAINSFARDNEVAVLDWTISKIKVVDKS